MYLNIQLPNAASLQRTQDVTTKVENILAKEPGVEYTTTVLGFSLLSYVQSQLHRVRVHHLEGVGRPEEADPNRCRPSRRT